MPLSSFYHSLVLAIRILEAAAKFSSLDRATSNFLSSFFLHHSSLFPPTESFSIILNDSMLVDDDDDDLDKW